MDQFRAWCQHIKISMSCLAFHKYMTSFENCQYCKNLCYILSCALNAQSQKDGAKVAFFEFVELYENWGVEKQCTLNILQKSTVPNER